MTVNLPPGQRELPFFPRFGLPWYAHKTPPEVAEVRIEIAGPTGSRATVLGADLDALPSRDQHSDFHCVTKFSMLGVEWGGVPAAAILELAPPAPEVTHVMVWAEYGFSSNLRISDFADDNSIFATHCNGEPLTAEHGFPVRMIVPHLYAWKGPKWVRGVEYMVADRRGFWEERGYHNIGDPWREQRYSYQEEPGEGPEL